MGLLEDWWDVQQLERMWKMGESQEIFEDFDAAYERVAQLRKRITELEQALRGCMTWIKEMADSGDGGNFDAEDIDAYIAGMNALK